VEKLARLRPPPPPPTILLPNIPVNRYDANDTDLAQNEPILYVGYVGPELDQLALRHSQVYFFNAAKMELSLYTPVSSKSLARRYFLIEKAKVAKIVGIVVGTLSTSGFVKAVERVKYVVEKAGLKAYVFLVGKINPAKLANFPDVDVFVMVACPNSSFFDSKEFAKPIVTPFEMERALTTRPEEWTMGAFDFSALLNEPVFDPPSEPVYSSANGGVLVNLKPDKQLALVYSSPAADMLALKSFRGLESKVDQVPAQKAIQGMGGVASRLKKEDGVEI